MTGAAHSDPFAGGALLATGPTTDAQRELLAAARLGTDHNLAYNEGIILRFGVRPDPDRLIAALTLLHRRHDALRFTFSSDDEAAFLWDHPLAVERVALPEGEELEEAFEALVRRLVTSPFDLDQGPLFRAALVTPASAPWRLILMAHHLVCDGWSYGVLIRELAEIYQTGSDAGLPPAPAYLDFARRERTRERAGADAATLDFWTRQFDGSWPALDLPTDRPRRRDRSLRSERLDVTLEGNLAGELRAFASRAGSTLFGVLAGGWYAFLHRLTGQTDLALALPASGQLAVGQPGLVGHCVNVLPVRTVLSRGERPGRLIERVNQRILDAFEHQEFTVGRLLRTVAVPRDPSRPPVTPVMFNLDRPFHRELATFGDLNVTLQTVPRVAEFFELFLNVIEEPDRLRLECQFAADLFDADTVREWIHGYSTLVEAMAREPGSTIESLAVTRTATRERMLGPWQGPVVPVPPDRTIHGWIEHVARAHGDAPAVVAGASSLTYGDLVRQSAALSHALRDRGIGPGRLVALAVSRTQAMLVSILGVLGAGAAYVPLDPEYPPARLRLMLEDAGPAVLLADLDLPPEVADGLGVPALDLRTLVVEPREQFPPFAADPVTAPAYVIYTSGSSGRPKGVQVAHAAVVNFLAGMQEALPLEPGERGLALTTLSFDIAVLELFLPLTLGGTVVVIERDGSADPAGLAAALETHRITLMQATPTTWGMLLDAGWPGRGDLLALVGGERVPASLADGLLGRVRELWNMYGPTETTVWSTCHRVRQGDDPVPLGRPIANTRVHVVDHAGQPVPVGAVGEILLGGRGVALGYLNRPDLTGERFVPDPVEPRAGLVYRTGDQGRWRHDGVLLFAGRADDQVKVHGHRVELGEIETVLAAHPVVSAAAATVHGEDGDRRLCVYYVLEPDRGVEGAELREWLARHLPPPLIPQHLARLERLPLTPNGKIDRRALPAPNPAPARRPAAPPATPMERMVGAIWSEVLGLTDVGRDDDFYELGGHSILLTRTAVRLAKTLGFSVPLRLLFDAPRLADLAARLEAIRAVTPPAAGAGPGTTTGELLI